MDDEHEDQSHAIDFQQSSENFFLRLCVPTVLRAVSVAVRWRFRKCTRRIVLSWHRDVTRGRPDRGRSAKCPVSLKRLTRRSIVETLTPKWLATCCCLWSCISNAIALPIWTSVNRTMIEKKVQSSVKMKRKIGKRFEERCVSLKCTKWCEEILCWRFKHACFARNFGFPYCPCNALCSARLNDFTHWVDSTSTKDSYTRGSHS